jgi:hypothetical protein
MSTNDWLLIAIASIGAVALVGIFFTKTAGFGRFTVSLLLLILVLLFTSLFFATGKIESATFANIAFAVLGYAGGLISNKQ